MYKPDDFSQYYAELLDGIYDCVDRIVLNAFFPMGQTGGGMRSWWRNLRGDDSQLDDKHLREMAGTFSRRLHAFCGKQGIAIIEAGSGERKHELAEPHLPKDPTFSGLFLVILAMRRLSRILVIPDVGDAPRRSILLEQHEAPAHQDDLALAVGVLSNDGRDVAWKDRRQWLEYDRPVVRNPEETGQHLPLFMERI
jgi:hypothetical protein